MDQSSTKSKLALLIALSLGLSFVQAGILSAPLLRVIHISYGRLQYWVPFLIGTCLLWSLGFVPAALSLLVVVTAVGAFREFEQVGRSWTFSGLASLFTGLMVAAAGLWAWSFQEGWSPIAKVRSIVEQFVAEAGPMLGTQSGPGATEFNPELMLAQVPSLVGIMLVVALAFSMAMERTIVIFFRLKEKEENSELDLTTFKVPDALVWVSLVAFLFTVVELGINGATAVGANVMNVMVVLYLFQGLAVVESYLRHYKVGVLWRMIAYTVLIFQLFFLPIFMGFVDFWFDFRARLKKTKETSDSKTD